MQYNKKEIRMQNKFREDFSLNADILSKIQDKFKNIVIDQHKN